MADASELKPTGVLESGLDVLENEDAPWCDPDCRTPIPSGTRQAVAVAASSLCSALAGRHDSPAVFVHRVRQALRHLDDACDVLKSDWNKDHGKKEN